MHKKLGFWRYPVGQTDTRTDSQMHSSQYFATALADEVIILLNSSVPLLLNYCQGKEFCRLSWNNGDKMSLC